MISKCQNIVINRTKFSEFPEFDVNSQSAEGLKLVGYIESVDLCTGEPIKQNVAVDYSSVSEVTIKTPPNLYIDSLINGEYSNYITKAGAGNWNIAYRILDSFEGSFIQIQIDSELEEDLAQIFADTDREGKRSLAFSFDRTIPLGKEIKLLIKSFPADESFVIRQLDYIKGDLPANKGILYQGIKNTSPKNVLITFIQTVGTSTTGTVSAANRIMKPVTIEIID